MGPINLPLKAVGWDLGFVGAVALLLAAMIATPLGHQDELTSVSSSV